MLPLEMVYSFDPVPPPPSAFEHPQQHLYAPVLPDGHQLEGDEDEAVERAQGAAEDALPEQGSTSDRHALAAC